MNWEEVTRELEAPLDQAAVRPAPRGKFGEYVDALHVIREANRIFGHEGWSYEVTRLELVSSKTVQLDGQNGPYEQERVGYVASVRVTVDGTVREGTAVGSGMGHPNNTADHHEAAVKEAETDALKRAMRTFGNTFGLALYEKDKSKREVEARPDPAMIATLKNNMLTAIRNAPSDQAAMNIANSEKFDEDLQRLREMEGNAAQEVIEEIEKRNKKDAA